jgi:hypothetical protein
MLPVGRQAISSGDVFILALNGEDGAARNKNQVFT